MTIRTITERRMPLISLLLLITIVSHIPAEKVTIGNITFECPEGWTIMSWSPNCYLLVDTPLSYSLAEQICFSYGAELLELEDEVEAKDIGYLVQNQKPQWSQYWIASINSSSACGGFWDIGMPFANYSSMTTLYISANVHGRWNQRASENYFLQSICKTEACVEGTFRCWDGSNCINNMWKCDGLYNCPDHSDEANCPNSCTYYYRQTSGTLNQSPRTCMWTIEGTPGQPLSINFSGIILQPDLDFLQVWSGGPTLNTSVLIADLTGQINNKTVHGIDHFLIVRQIMDLSSTSSGFSATWYQDPRLSPVVRNVNATDTWVTISSPYPTNIPAMYFRQYRIFTVEGSLITMEVYQKGPGIIFDQNTLSLVTDTNAHPVTYVSRTNSFMITIMSDGTGNNTPFQGRVKKGCFVEVTQTSGMIMSPNFNGHYPPSVTCSYIIKAPTDAQRMFHVKVIKFSLPDDADYVKIYNGSDRNSLLISPINGFNRINSPNASSIALGPNYLVEFVSNLIQTDGFFEIYYSLDCPEFLNRSNANVSNENREVNSMVTISCRTGFAFAQEEFSKYSSLSLICTEGGKWNVSRLPTCQDVYCGVPMSIKNGFIVNASGNAHYQAQVTYQCYPGFTLLGLDSRSTCGADQKWSLPPSCQASMCPNPSTTEHGNYNVTQGSGTDYGSIVKYNCNPGYDLVGSQYIWCWANAIWSAMAPKCIPRKCPQPEVDRAVVSPTGPVTLGANVTINCTSGYTNLAKNSTEFSVMCLENGFNVARNVCQDLNECQSSPNPCGANALCMNTVGSFRCVCHPGYNKTQSNICEDINECAVGDLKVCDSKFGYCNNTPGSYYCSCKSGYTLFTVNGTNNKTIPPSESGKRLGDVYYINNTCVPNVCMPPAQIKNGTLLSRRTLFYFNETVQYQCDFGFFINGSSMISCQANGSWSDSPPICVAYACSPLTPVNNSIGVFPNRATVLGEKVTLECLSQSNNSTYNKTLYCEYNLNTKNFSLQGDSPICPVIDCGDLKNIPGSSFIITPPYSYGSYFNFQCIQSFVLSGNSSVGNTTVFCEKTGRWGLGNLTCEGLQCSDPGTPGGMRQVNASYEVNGIVRYICSRPGFKPNQPVIQCIFSNGKIAWNMTTWPVCVDVESPTFTDCPTSPLIRKLYDQANFTIPSATDNSGLVYSITVNPPGFRMLTVLAASLNVTYTARDRSNNTNTCVVEIMVKDPILPPSSLMCPVFYTLSVNSSSSVTFDLRTVVNVNYTDSVTLTVMPSASVTVDASTVGTHPYRVRATNRFGFYRECAFIVEIRPVVCLEKYLSSNNSRISCGSLPGSCTVTCNSGFSFQDGQTTKSYSCTGENVWTPALPVRSCVEIKPVQYYYIVDKTYLWNASNITGAQDCLTAKLQDFIPIKISKYCVYDSSISMVFSVANVAYSSFDAQQIMARITLNVTSDTSLIDKKYFDICGLSLGLEGLTSDLFQILSLNCSSTFLVLNATNQILVNNDYSCDNGSTVQIVSTIQTPGKSRCVPCEPGYKYMNKTCIPCESGQFQDLMGQTSCKPCPNGANFSNEPRISASQCAAFCPLGFYKNQTQAANLSPCFSCPEDQYSDSFYSSMCKSCPSGTSTFGIRGATNSSDCRVFCPSGKYPVNNIQCELCPKGFYKVMEGNMNCVECLPTQTSNFPFDSTSSCMAVTNSSACANGGASAVYFHNSICECLPGFYGDTCLSHVDICKTAPCYNNGSCSTNGTNDTYTCTCPAGFNGTNCERDTVNNCMNDTCTNPQFCRDLVGTADCVCPSQSKYSGPKCNIILDLCQSSPCKNGGKCIDSGAGVRYICECQAGFTGYNCETNINDCDPNPCLYDGICTDGNNTYTCTCGNNKGKNCEIEPDFCELNNLCKNGFCYNNYDSSKAECECVDSYVKDGNSTDCMKKNICQELNCQNNSTCQLTGCLCGPGYEGSLCQHNIDDCLSNPCIHGTCKDLWNNFSCSCDTGFEGPTCANNVNDCSGKCSSNSSMNCTDEINDYKCTCKVGFTGKNCETDINECDSLPCMHNGMCTNGPIPGNYTCNCTDGWTGPNCETLPQFCSSNPCTNGGKCYSLQMNFFCQCNPGSYGQICENSTNLCTTVNPCINSSPCQSVNGTAVCSCISGYSGSSCQYLKDSYAVSPCGIGGTCITNSVGYSCQCLDSYSGQNCDVQSGSCASVNGNCPSSSSCLSPERTGIKEVVCLCGPRQSRSGTTCKDVDSNFDIFFTEVKNDTIRSLQPFIINSSTSALTMSFWIAPLQKITGKLVQLIGSVRTPVLAVSSDGIYFGNTDKIPFTTQVGPVSFEVGKWSRFFISWNATGHYRMFLDTTMLDPGTTMASFPSESVIFPYIGQNFRGYLSQLSIWGRWLTENEADTLLQSPFSLLNQSLLLGWTRYTSTIWTRVLTPSSVGRSKVACDGGVFGSPCPPSASTPPTLINCSSHSLDFNIDRVIQLSTFVNPRPTNPTNVVLKSVNDTLVTFGVYRLVYAAKDTVGNVGTCRFNAYVRRLNNTCSAVGLNQTVLNKTEPCGTGNGRIVQCPNNAIAPFSPTIMSCGKLGSYNLDDPFSLPPVQLCGAVSSVRYNANLTLKYGVKLPCGSDDERIIKQALEVKVRNLSKNWTFLCDDSNCTTLAVMSKCDVVNSSFIVVNISFTSLPATLTSVSSNITLTIRELLQSSAIERDVFDVKFQNDATLRKQEVVIELIPVCNAGSGLIWDTCVRCPAGSFLNQTSRLCQLCAIGYFTMDDGKPYCTKCDDGKTTLRPGSKECLVQCSEGQYFDINSGSCFNCSQDFYQPRKGQVACLPCPVGKSTEGTGTVNASGCFDICPAGTELRNPNCTECPRGFYREGITQDRCKECPPGKTTQSSKATSNKSCTLAACLPGQMRNNATNLCVNCSYGFYQPEKWQDMCLACNSNYTTVDMGSFNQSQCVFVCPAGYENRSGNTCLPCDQGKFRTDSLEDRFKSCQSCNSSFTTSTIASTSANNCNIRICTPGYYRNESDNLCYLCPKGRYQNTSLQTSCLPCPYNLTTQAQGAQNESQCRFTCTTGYQVLSSENRSCTPCPRGQYKDNQGINEFQNCMACPGGNTTENVASISSSLCSIPNCTAGEKIFNGVCQRCPVDSYQPEMYPNSLTACQNCSSGTGTVKDGQKLISDCKPLCGPGQQYSNNSCVACPIHAWNSGNITQRFELCAPCPDGFVSNETGATDIRNCSIRNCPPGKFINTSNNCEECPVGTYQDKPRQNQCTNCSVNTNTSTTGKTRRDDCTIFCAAGSEEKNNSGNCTKCDSDRFKPLNGYGLCAQCTGNFTSDSNRTTCNILYCDYGFTLNTSSNQCEPCLKGFYKDMRGNASPCSSCPLNTTTADVASTNKAYCSRTYCAAGFYAMNDTAPCLVCPIGTFKNVSGNQNCTPCSEEYTTAMEGSTSELSCRLRNCLAGQYRDASNNCQPCSIGYYQPNRGQTTCIQCPGNYTTLNSSSVSGNDCKIVCAPGYYRNTTNQCLPCDIGTYQPAQGQISCLSCGSNYTTRLTASVNQSECYIICPAGYYKRVNSNSNCDVCPQGQYQNISGSDSCRSCGVNQTTLQLGSKSELDCQPICPSGQYLNTTNRMCNLCPLGTFSQVVNSTYIPTVCQNCPDGNTTLVKGATDIAFCNVVDCVQGQFLTANIGCRSCPKGTYQPYKSQEKCIQCPANQTTLLEGRFYNTSCVENCSDGSAYEGVSGSCVPCGIGYYRNSQMSEYCIRCPVNKTTIATGQKSCIDSIPGSPPAASPRFVVVRIILQFRIRSCDNKDQIFGAIVSFIRVTIQNTAKRFSSICTTSCTNFAITFNGGCLDGRSSQRKKRQSQPTNQTATIVANNTPSEVTDAGGNTTLYTCDALQQAFYDTQISGQSLEMNSVRLDSISSLSCQDICQPGQRTVNNKCENCLKGSFSTNGFETTCTLCPANTYQNLTGQTMCLPCPSKTFTVGTNSTSQSDCKNRCELQGSPYCANGVPCIPDSSTSDGARCDCGDKFSGPQCQDRQTTDKGPMIGGIIGGIIGFLIIVLVITSIIACLRRSKQKAASKNGKSISNNDEYSENHYSYNNPVYDGTGYWRGNPGFMVVNPAESGHYMMNPAAVDDRVTDFYRPERISAVSSRAKTYESAWDAIESDNP